MFITDLFENEAGVPGYTSEKDDNSVMKLNDLRKTRLTLAHLNRLRMAHDIRKFEHETKLQTVKKQYAPAPEAGGGMPGL